MITVEPIIASGTHDVRTCADGWTTVTANASRAAHAEHTIVITRGQPLVLTAA